MVTVKSNLSKVVADFLRDRYKGRVRVHDSKSVLDMSSFPLAVVYVERSEPLSPGYSIAECMVRITVMHDAEKDAPESAEQDAAEVFAVVEESELQEFAEAAEMLISSATPVEDRLEFVEMRWQHVRTLEVIADLND
jgi:hypothetical protein